MVKGDYNKNDNRNKKYILGNCRLGIRKRNYKIESTLKSKQRKNTNSKDFLHFLVIDFSKQIQNSQRPSTFSSQS